MKLSLLPAILLICFLSAFQRPGVKILKTFNSQQIKKVEQQVLARFKVRVDIEVLARNAASEITSLKITIYDKVGQRSGLCESDKFGAAMVFADGCAVADKGQEKYIK
ncbi:hypothetical protein [Dyadobacter psychrotolerans]|uniref:Uncharacterized protein n=1 Tax=Dyadobacter psychrotolerans TaxID=2541721 RepID=A0A4R5D4P7_9BACT|nr:hypothetical protein [Dyadobacter psychrotolerans]TDE08286.1 hypothetical protein E0F88_32825 [Dyadobacter psychrotolerans]